MRLKLAKCHILVKDTSKPESALIEDQNEDSLAMEVMQEVETLSAANAHAALNRARWAKARRALLQSRAEQRRQQMAVQLQHQQAETVPQDSAAQLSEDSSPLAGENSMFV